MTCTTCGAANPPGQKFCGDCGSRLASGCPTCGATNPPGQKFCGDCGTPLAGEATAARRGAGPAAAADSPGPSGPTPSAERRLVSILFADLVGFTPFAEERDAEDVRDTLGRYFELATGVIGRYGGTVEKFIGDAVMAVWGTPTTREDDAERAVRAALELVDAVRTLGPTIQARAGVMTGEAAVTIGATNQGMVAGDLVNTASRIQSVAAPGTVLVGEATFRAASSSIAFEPAGEQLLKGKTSPVPAWRALRVVAQRGGHGRSDLPEPPFVGRDDEFRLLKDLLSATGRDRRTRLVSITGPGGIGKSRLAWELEKYIDGLVEPIYWHRGRSPAYGDGITFWALGEMVRRRAGLAESDDEATTRERIARTVADFVPDEADRRWVEPALLTLLGLEPAPAGGRDVLFAAWRIFFERVAARGTTILLFEDLQWADGGLLDFIASLIEWSKGVPLLVVTLARPELFDRRPDWGAGTRNFTSISLEPLGEPAMRELLAGFVPGLPAAAVSAILARADGMPLYAVETVRALVADGRLVLADGTYRPVGELGTLTIPDTLRSLIASRLDGLEPADRTLVQDASVLGQAFTLGSLAAVRARDPADLEPRLRGLVRRELFEVEADPRSPERGHYHFVQSLIREVAYGTLARRDRRTRHLAVARHFEGLGEEEFAGALATHYLAAHEASAEGPEAEAIAIQARLALRGAADRAATLGAHREAVGYLQQALDVTTDAADQADLLARAAKSASDGADNVAAEALARRAVEVNREAGDVLGTATASALLGSVLLYAGQPAPAIEVLERALADLPESASDEVRARLLTNLSRAYLRDDQAERAVEVVERALPLAERLGLDEVIADAFNNKGSGLSYLGRKREASALMQAAIEIGHASGVVSAELRARSNLASVLWGDDPRRALELQRGNLDLSQRVGNRGMANWILASLTVGSVASGRDWDRVLAEVADASLAATGPAEELRLLSCRVAVQVPRGIPVVDAISRMEALVPLISDPSAAATLASAQGELAMVRGDYVAAHEAMVRAAEFTPLAGYFLLEAVRAALWLGDGALARTSADRLDARPDAHAALARAGRRACRAGIAALEGRREDAVAGYREAFEAYRGFGYDFALAQLQLDFIRLLGADAPGAQAAATEAREVFTRVGAAPYLELLDATLARSDGRAGRPQVSPGTVIERSIGEPAGP